MVYLNRLYWKIIWAKKFECFVISFPTVCKNETISKNEAVYYQEKTGCNERKCDETAKTGLFKKRERKNGIEG